MKWLILFLIPSIAFANPTGLSFGDSIDLGRTAYTRLAIYPTIDFRHAFWANENLVPDTTNYYLGTEIADGWNDGYSTTLLQDVQSQLWAGTFFDVITFNSGIHDVARINSNHQCDSSAPIRIDLPTYQANIQAIASIIKQHSSVAIWIDTTPVQPGNQLCAFQSDVDAYNAAAEAIAKSDGFYILTLTSAYQIPNDVHYTQEGYQYLGEQMAACVLTAMEGLQTSECHK